MHSDLLSLSRFIQFIYHGKESSVKHTSNMENAILMHFTLNVEASCVHSDERREAHVECKVARKPISGISGCGT